MEKCYKRYAAAIDEIHLKFTAFVFCIYIQGKKWVIRIKKNKMLAQVNAYVTTAL